MTGPIITLKPATMLRPTVERWAWKVSRWFSDDPDHIIAQGVEEGIDKAWAAARRAVVEPASLIRPPTDPEATE